MQRLVVRAGLGMKSWRLPNAALRPLPEGDTILSFRPLDIFSLYL
jgi:hypothetical protein